jgi:hypothetical protein
MTLLVSASEEATTLGLRRPDPEIINFQRKAYLGALQEKDNTRVERSKMLLSYNLNIGLGKKLL